MSYEYDAGASRLDISEGLEVRDDKHLVMVSAEHLEGGTITVPVRDEDAPALALALLEQAGVKEIDPTTVNASATPERLALYWLYQWQGLRKAQSEQEAFDAEVAAFRLNQFKAQSRRPDPSKVADAWADMDDESRELWRSEYRAAREFFLSIIPAEGTVTVPAYAADPGFEQLVDLASRSREQSLKLDTMMLSRGAPEPGRDTQWRSKGEARDAYYSIYFDGEYWVIDGRFDRVGRYYWVNIPDTFFPMTEVTEG